MKRQAVEWGKIFVKQVSKALHLEYVKNSQILFIYNLY